MAATGQQVFPVVQRLIYTTGDCTGQAYVESVDYYPSNLYVTDVLYNNTVVPLYSVTSATASIMPASQKVNESCAAFVGSGSEVAALVNQVGSTTGTNNATPLSIH